MVKRYDPNAGKRSSERTDVLPSVEVMALQPYVGPTPNMLRKHLSEQRELQQIVNHISETQSEVNWQVAKRTNPLVRVFAHISDYVRQARGLPVVRLDDLFIEQRENVEGLIQYGVRCTQELSAERDDLAERRQELIDRCVNQRNAQERLAAVSEDIPDYHSVKREVKRLGSGDGSYEERQRLAAIKRQAQDAYLATTVLTQSLRCDEETVSVIDDQDDAIFESLKGTAQAVVHARKALQTLDVILGSELALLRSAAVRNQLRQKVRLIGGEVDALDRCLIAGFDNMREIIQR